MTKEQGFTLTEIYNGLRQYRGAVNVLADEYGTTREWIRLVLTGKYTDNGLVKKAAEIWLRYAEEASKNTNAIADMVSRARSLSTATTTVA